MKPPPFQATNGDTEAGLMGESLSAQEQLNRAWDKQREARREMQIAEDELHSAQMRMSNIRCRAEEFQRQKRNHDQRPK